MFKILVPTDFSPNANNALDFAIEIANRIGGYLLLYHVYHVPSTTGSFISVEKYITKDAELEMARLYKKVSPNVKSNVIMEYKMANSAVIPQVCNKAKKDNYDLIIMGTQGSTGLKEQLFGSNASGIMNRTKVPVLAIPNDIKYKSIDHIVLAVDDQPISSGQVVATLQSIKNKFHAALSIFHLYTDGLQDKGIDDSVRKEFSDSSFQTTQFDSNQNIHKLIDAYAVKNKADLLCMIRRKRGIWYELLNPSITKKEVGNSSMPLLILHD